MKRVVSAVIIVVCALSQGAAGQTARGGGRQRAGASSPRPPQAKGPSAAGARGARGGETVESIFARNLLGRGGSYALSKIRSQVVRGYVHHSLSSQAGSLEYYAKGPEKILMVINSPIGQFIEGFDGTARWFQTPFGALVTHERVLGSTLDQGPRHDLASGAAYKVRGKARVGEREADVVEVFVGGKQVDLMFFDSATGLLLRSDPLFERREEPNRPGKRVDIKIFYERYAEVDGVQVPVLVRFVLPEYTMTANVYEVKHNVEVDDALFASPKGAHKK